MKFKIGEFSKLCQVTVKTLRHYEEVGLLIPFEVDEWTGYRYYDIGQLRQMSRIAYLKRLGFSLEEVSDLFQEGREYPDPEAVQAKAGRCKEEIGQLMWRQEELARLETLLRQPTDTMEKVFEKPLPSRVFATHRQMIGSYLDLFDLCPNLIGPEMHRLGCECPKPPYCFTVEYNEEYGVDIDIEYFEAVVKKGEDSAIIRFKELPAVPIALCISHYGAYQKMPETFAELFAYAEAKGYEAAERPRFCYIDGIWNKESENEWLTEIQLPVKHRAPEFLKSSTYL